MGVVRRHMRDKITTIIDESDRLGLAVLRGDASQVDLNRAKRPIISDIDYLIRYLTQLRQDVEELQMPEVTINSVGK
jgi:hypothetical protein